MLQPREATTRTDPFIERFECSFPTRSVSQVRMEVKGIMHCPAWHQGAGGDAWFFCDEVMVFQ